MKIFAKKFKITTGLLYNSGTKVIQQENAVIFESRVSTCAVTNTFKVKSHEMPSCVNNLSQAIISISRLNRGRTYHKASAATMDLSKT